MERLDSNRQSTFVTVCSWVLIVNSVFLVFFIAQTILSTLGLYIFTGADTLSNAFLQIGLMVPGIIFLLVGIGLLKRRNWARIIVMIVCSIWVLVMIAGFIVSILSRSPLTTPPEFESVLPNTTAFNEGFNAFVLFDSAVSFVSITILSVFFYWIIKTLKSDEIRSEFSDKLQA